MSDLVDVKGFLMRKNAYDNSIVLRDVDFIDNNIKDEAVEFMVEEGVTELELNDGFGFKLENVGFLRQIKWIESITILKRGGMDLKDLGFLQNLKKITNNYSGDPIDFSSFEKLNYANLLWTKHRATILERGSLEEFVVYGFKAKNLESLRNLINLRQLSLVSSTVENLDGLENLTNLESIEIYFNSKIHDLTALENCKKLKKIQIEGLSKLKKLDFLERCINLEFLSVKGCKNIIDNNAMFKCYNLKVFSYTDSGSISSIKGIEKMNHLERFLIYNTKIEDGETRPLAKIKSIHVINFNDKKNYTLKLEDIKKELNIK